MPNIPLNDRAFEVQVRTAQGTFETENIVISDDDRDAMATDPSYQSHAEGDDEVLSQVSHPSPETILLLLEEAMGRNDISAALAV